MSKNKSMKPLAAAIGTAVVATLATMPVAQADASPFGMTDLGSGYQVVAEGKCGAGKCGGEKKADEGKCGAGKCGGEKKSEGKCGAGKCGGSK